MFVPRSALAIARRAAPRAIARRTFTTTFVRRDASDEKKPTPPTTASGQPKSLLEGYKKLEDIKTEADLFAPGAKPGTVPTDIEQATGLERLELLGKVQGVDIFDMRPLDSSRLGTPEDPIVVNSAGNEQYCGCTGFPSGSHGVLWVTLTREEPQARCMECGSTYKMHYIGPADDPHAHDHGHHVENKYPRPKNMSDFIKEDYLNA